MSNPGTTNLVSYWEFEESSGTRFDSHGSNDLTDNNTVGVGTGIQGNGADFEASNSEYFSITDAAQTGLDLGASGTDFAISQWIKLESVPANNAFFNMFWKWDGGTNNRSYVLEYHVTAGGVHSSSILISSTGGGGAYNTTVSLGTTLVVDTWYHWVYNYDASAGTLAVYINGSLAGTHTGVPTSIYNGTATFWMGQGQGYFDGIRDEVAVFNDLLTTDEITWLYNSGSGRSYSDLTGGGGGGYRFVPQLTPFAGL